MAFFDIGSFLPFFFVLAIVFGSLEVSGIFKNRGVKIVISLVIAFFAASSQAVSGFIISIMPYAAMFFVAFFFIGFVLSFFRGKKEGGGDFTILLVILALVLIFLGSGNSLGFSLDQDTVGIAVLVAVVLIFVAAWRSSDK